MVLSSGNDRVQSCPRKRHRSAQSCQECRRRKVRCDRSEPCGHCLLSKKQCHYDPRSAPSGRIVNGPAPASQSAHEFAPIIHAQVASAPRPQASVIARGSSPASDSFHLTRRVPDVQLSSQSSHDNGIVRSEGPRAATSANLDNVAAGPQDGKISLNKSRLFGRSHWTNSTLEVALACRPLICSSIILANLQQLQKTAAVLNPETGNATDNEVLARLKWEIAALLQKCKSLSKNIKSSQQTRCSSFPRAYLSIAKEYADNMVHLYVTHFESVFRILHIPSFWIEYEKYWSDPAEGEYISQLKIQLVTALGMIIHQDTINTTDVYSTARQWLYAAQEWLSGPLKKSRISIGSLQVQCLLILARQALSVGGDTAWISMGLVVRTAMQMGLHRDPKHFKRMGILEGEIRRRLWATVLELNVQAALDAGMPPTLSLDEFDTEGPSNLNDEDIDEQTEALRELPATATTDSSLQRFLFQSLRPRLEVAQRMNSITPALSEMSYNELIALTTSIASACRSCSAHILKTNSFEIASFHSNLADLLLRRFILHLHRPLAGRARTNPQYYFSRKMSLDAAMALISSASKNAQFERLVLLGAGMFKNRMIHASLAVASELLIEVEEQGPGEYHSPSREPSGYRKMLTEALREALRQSAERIRLGETNVKLHMKLSMAMRQAEVAGAHSSSMQQLAQSAKESLEASYATMQARATHEGTDIESRGSGGMSEDFDPEDFDPESFFLDSNFSLDDLFFIPADFDMDGAARQP
ncbi:uncharacterized protein PV07_09659 [Cladophialophora immunda]|uniref:Zn(2)-C6 fungal-type domain-containing protein n=1 Tax=Cladophialophora immunda TaxID=569365 RepID=A0A0D2C7Y1_9EURO|nr:uncharacterized protein PV07_09659 [Cladophialophora immunda]KIW26575.1 hypothetical protein PV07_09659 [Cladophialophora immunda]